MRRELDGLRTETAHANLLLQALDALLVVQKTDDPFASAFSALLPVFEATHAIVLVQPDDTADILECAGTSHAGFKEIRWRLGAKLAKVLAGRIVTTLASHDLTECAQGGISGIDDAQPALYLPLRVRERRGLLVLLRPAEDAGFDRSHVTLAKKFSLLASHALALRNANQTEVESHRLKDLTDKLRKSQKALAFRANHDQLTGLPNRLYVKEILDGMLARKEADGKLALAFIDLDDFKRVNDYYGHEAGDILLREVAERITSQIRTTDILSRISGDEFVVILNSTFDRRGINTLINRIRRLLNTPFMIEGMEVKVSGSIGVALYPDHGQDYDTLRRNADAAMYQAKLTSKGSVAYFSRSLGQKMTERMALEQNLRIAVERREFHCALQPKVDICTSRIHGFEALLRWVDNAGIVHAPGTFLQLAGELGLLDDIATMLVDELVAKLPQLDAEFGREMTYSINMTAKQASNPNFMRSMARLIATSGRAQNFMIELTEESFLRAGVFQAQILPLLRSAGIRISIDDFGTGYSSLSTLADVTADELKIDRSLIMSIHERPRSQSILRAIESLGSTLGIDLVAEGVETRDEIDYLRARTGIHLAQGYYFYRPRFIDELTASRMRAPAIALRRSA
jgi:diguanylate cyclase (GGDEF)-like protein